MTVEVREILSVRTQVVIILQGIKGICKCIILKIFIKKVLGAGTSFKTSNPQDNLFGTHSVALQNRVFLLLEKVSGHDICPYMSKFKDLTQTHKSSGATDNLSGQLSRAE